MGIMKFMGKQDARRGLARQLSQFIQMETHEADKLW